MASLHLENIPDELISRLEKAALDHRRDLNGEVVERLDQSFGHRAGQPTRQDLSELARRIRGSGSADWLTPEFIRDAREWGRE